MVSRGTGRRSPNRLVGGRDRSSSSSPRMNPWPTSLRICDDEACAYRRRDRKRGEPLGGETGPAPTRTGPARRRDGRAGQYRGNAVVAADATDPTAWFGP